VWCDGVQFHYNNASHVGDRPRRKFRESECAALGAGLSSQLFWPGLEVSPNEGRGKDNEHRDDGGGDKYRIGWHGWSPVRGA
jgi:hypothetical protein